MQARVLIVEDESDLATTLAFNLRKEGYEVHVAHSAEEGLRLAKQHKMSVALLDVMLPGMSGTQLCQVLRKDVAQEGLGVIMLTAKGDEIDRVVGLEIGADDYVVKPFSVRELMLRVRALLRRTSAAPEPSPNSEFGVLKIDTDGHRVFVDASEVELTALEFKLLATLFERRGRVQTREQLLEFVWELPADLTTRTVDTHVKRLRKKIGTAGDYIETVRGVGYRFKDSVE